jgi:hypothetical protein
MRHFQAGLDTEMRQRLKYAATLSGHPAGDWVGVCRVRDFEASSSIFDSRKEVADSTRVSETRTSQIEEIDQELMKIQRKDEYLKAQDVFVELLCVPPENEGSISLPHGISLPGTYVLKYFTESSPLPLAVSESFTVEFPKVFISTPGQVEIGRNFKITLSVTNFDFENAAATGIVPPRMSSTDTLAIFAVGDNGEDQKCMWLEMVPEWTETTSLNITSLKPPAPGQYRIKYRLGQYNNYVAGEALFSIKFPRKGSNRFSTFELETLTMEEIREARIFVSLNQVDMEAEVNILMNDVASLVQSELEANEVTCTFVCLNFRQDKEETTFENGICHAVRGSLDEIDMCRPFFIGLLGERYGLVPTLKKDDSAGIQKIYAEFPWMEKFKNPFVNTMLGYSMLEIELLYSVLMVEPEGALVYNRSTNYIQNHVHPDERNKYLDVGCGEMKTTAARSAMADLKMRIHGVKNIHSETYDHPSEIAAMIKENLVQIIRKKYPIASIPTSAEKKRIMVEALCKAHYQLIDKELLANVTKSINEAIESEICHMIMITGEAGSGKTAICANWIKQHILKYRLTPKDVEAPKIDVSSCSLPDGPRPDLTPHIVICTLVSHLMDQRIDAVLFQLFSEIKHLTKTKLSLPVEGLCLEAFPAWMQEAARHGLVWVIDNLHLVVGVEEWQFLARLPKGVCIIATCDSSHVDLIQSVTPQTTSHILPIEGFDAGSIWALQQHYCRAYGLEPDDEFVFRIVEIESVRTIAHARIVLMAHRLMLDQGAPWSREDLDNVISAVDAPTAFVRLVQLVQKWEPMLAQVIMMTAWSHRGLREMELLSMLDKLDQAKLRMYKLCLLDELLAPLFGIYDFVNLSFKVALRQSMLAKERDKEWPLAMPTLQALICFFSDSKCSQMRRCVECPTLFSADATTDRLFEYMTSAENAATLVPSFQVHWVSGYLDRLQISRNQFVSFLLDDMQNQFGKRVSRIDDEIKNSKQSNPEESLRLVFEMFALKESRAEIDASNVVSKSESKKQSHYSMDHSTWFRAISYLELLDHSEEHSISEKDIEEIFQHISGADVNASIHFMEFRHGMIEIGKKMGMQIMDLIAHCLNIAQLHRLFNFYAAGGNEKAVGVFCHLLCAFVFSFYKNVPLDATDLFSQIMSVHLH